MDASHFELPRLGMYSWDLSQNRIIGDEVYADYLGIDTGKLRSGISVEDAIAQIADSDREKAARSTHAAILSGKFSSIVFRINDRSLLAYGRCLRGGDGLPSIFCGALTEVHARSSAAGLRFEFGSKLSASGHFSGIDCFRGAGPNIQRLYSDRLIQRHWSQFDRCKTHRAIWTDHRLSRPLAREAAETATGAMWFDFRGGCWTRMVAAKISLGRQTIP